jgi:hypothetical protein
MDTMIAHDTRQEITSGEAAMLIGCTSETVRNLADRGQLRWRRIANGARVFPLDDVLRVAAERRRNPERRGRPIRLRDLISTIKASSASQPDSSSKDLVDGTLGSLPAREQEESASATRSI